MQPNVFINNNFYGVTLIFFLGTFCCICMAMMILSIIGTIATSYMTEQSTTNSQVPVWVQVLVLKHLARIIFFKKDFAKEELVTPVTADNGKCPLQDFFDFPLPILFTRTNFLLQILKMQKNLKQTKMFQTRGEH